MGRGVGVSLNRTDHVPWADIKVSGPIMAGQLSAGFSGGALLWGTLPAAAPRDSPNQPVLPY